MTKWGWSSIIKDKLNYKKQKFNKKASTHQSLTNFKFNKKPIFKWLNINRTSEKVSPEKSYLLQVYLPKITAVKESMDLPSKVDKIRVQTVARVVNYLKKSVKVK